MPNGPIGKLAGDSGLMILSSADIARLIGADAIIRQEASIVIVQGRPGIDVGDTVYVYVEKFPTIDEFEATWKIWVTDNSGMGDLVLGALQSRLPRFESQGDHYTTTDFASESTEVDPKVAMKMVLEARDQKVDGLEELQKLQEGVRQGLNAVRDIRNGKDGKDGLDGLPGLDGKDGQDGKDLNATDTKLFDLKDVEETKPGVKEGQILTWNGKNWTNQYAKTLLNNGNVRILNDLRDVNVDGVTNGQFIQYSSDLGRWIHVTVSPGQGVEEAPQDGRQYVRQDASWSEVDIPDSGVEEAPQDGRFYVRQDGQWIDLESALDSLGYIKGGDIDGGDFNTGTSNGNSGTVDGGNFS